ncbi:hypothetical protein [Granulicella cerasi]|nr:hypothetical protein [Granulicella cerasi]
MNHYGAPSNIVNRTHRVVRAEATRMREQRSRTRSLWVPFAVVSPIVVFICYSMWNYAMSLEATGVAPVAELMPDANYQFCMVLVWSLPVTVGLLALVWKLRSKAADGRNA